MINGDGQLKIMILLIKRDSPGVTCGRSNDGIPVWWTLRLHLELSSFRFLDCSKPCHGHTEPTLHTVSTTPWLFSKIYKKALHWGLGLAKRPIAQWPNPETIELVCFFSTQKVENSGLEALNGFYARGLRQEQPGRGGTLDDSLLQKYAVCKKHMVRMLVHI